MKFFESCSQHDQVQLSSSVTQGFRKIDAEAYVRSHLSVFLLSYRTKHVALVLILQSYHIFIELKNIDCNLVELTWIWEISLFLAW